MALLDKFASVVGRVTLLAATLLGIVMAGEIAVKFPEQPVVL